MVIAVIGPKGNLRRLSERDFLKAEFLNCQRAERSRSNNWQYCYRKQ